MTFALAGIIVQNSLFTTLNTGVGLPTDPEKGSFDMPGWLQAWSNVNPVTILSDALRGLLVSGPVAAPALQSLLWALGFTVVFAPLAVRVFKRRT